MLARTLTRRAALLSALSWTLEARRLRAEQSMPHVVLLGDSVFDNGAYVGGSPDVSRQLAMRTSGVSKITSLARDGATISDVRRQLAAIPNEATHVIISAGGNDALRGSTLLDEPAGSVSEALAKITAFRRGFAESYNELLQAAGKRGMTTAVCTIYEPRYPEPARQIAATALAVLNDHITRAAFSNGMGLIDLRIICSSDGDFANAIEPSAAGGEKIAAAIVRFVANLPSSLVVAN
jgi:lysophospholipase L1-like esterase